MAERLQELSGALAAAVENASASVVSVDARQRFPASGIVWSPDGVIVTAHHVVQRDEDITIVLPTGEVVPATLVGRDPSIDLAVLRVEVADLAAPAWVDLESVRVGSLALAVGRIGENVQAALGIVQAIGGAPRAAAGRHHRHHGQRRGPVIAAPEGRYLRPDVVMYPGFSGGPLIDASGQVIGMNTSAFWGTPLTIPHSVMGAAVEMLLTHGHVRHGYLGVGSQPARLPKALAKELDQETGLLLASVESGSPAEQGGLLVGDIIIAFDDVPTLALDDLLALLSGDRVGQEVPVRIVRGGQVQTVTVTIGERP